MFEPRHQQEFGVEVAERDLATGAVVAVRCLFCAHLGRDPAPETALRQRRRSVHVWKNLSPVSYRRHHEGQHATLWVRYQGSTPAEKEAFFGVNRVVGEVVQSRSVSDATAAATAAATSAFDDLLMARGGTALAPAAAVVVVERKRPVGRPRADGSIPMQWSERMSQRLVELRTETFAALFADSTSRASVNGGWALISSKLTEEFGMKVDTEQCKTKLKQIEARAQRSSSSNQYETSTTSTTSTSATTPVNGAMTAPVITQNAAAAAERARRATLVPPSLTAAEASAIIAGNASAPIVKRGRGRPRKDAAAVPAPVALKKQRVDASVDELNSSGSSINTILLRKIYRTVVEQKDAFTAQKEALAAQKAATEAQTASIQELLQVLKAREAQGASRLLL